jgi:uncharacterized protein (DUF1330 family)
MPAYYIAQMTIKDEERYASLRTRSTELIKKFNGRVLAADSNYVVAAGELSASRIIIIEFSSEEDFNAFYYSPEYEQQKVIIREAAETTIVLVHGLE